MKKTELELLREIETLMLRIFRKTKRLNELIHIGSNFNYNGTLQLMNIEITNVVTNDVLFLEDLFIYTDEHRINNTLVRLQILYNVLISDIFNHGLNNPTN